MRNATELRATMLQNDEYAWRRWLRLPKLGSTRGRRPLPESAFLPLVYDAKAAGKEDL